MKRPCIGDVVERDARFWRVVFVQPNFSRYTGPNCSTRTVSYTLGLEEVRRNPIDDVLDAIGA